MANRGFTLVEMLLTTGVLVIILAIAVPLYQSLDNSNQEQTATEILVQDLYQAQSYSRNEASDSAWGVALNGQNITLFSGSTYASRNSVNDVTYNVPSAVTLSGPSEIDYSKLYGLPTVIGSYTISGGGSNSTVTVNGKGMVDY